MLEQKLVKSKKKKRKPKWAARIKEKID